jgi:dUTP pyrophosphatase
MSFVEEMIEAKIAKPKSPSVKFCVMEGRQAKSPVRAHSDDAGIDIFAPLDMEEVTIQPNEAYLVNTGLKCICPKGYAMFVMNKSGVAVKKCLDHGAEVIDEGYRGEIGIHLINVGKEAQTIKAGDKIIQVVLLPVGYHMVEMVSEDEYSRMGETSRGAGAYGSTGNV